MIKKLMTDIMTGIDNQTFDIGRVTGFMSFIVYYVMGVCSFIFHQGWTALEFSSGIAAMAVGIGLHLKIKETTEPGEKK